MESEGSSPGLQEPATWSYPEPVHAASSHILKIHLANSMATAVSEPDLYMLLTLHEPNLKFFYIIQVVPKDQSGPVAHVCVS